jgi:hypothetical protein
MKMITEHEIIKNARVQVVAGLLSISPGAEFRYKRRWRKSLLIWRTPGESPWRAWRICFYDLSTGVLRLSDCYAPDFPPGSGECGIRNDREFSHLPGETFEVARAMAGETVGIRTTAVVDWQRLFANVKHTTSPYRWTAAADAAYRNRRTRKLVS